MTNDIEFKPPENVLTQDEQDRETLIANAVENLMHGANKDARTYAFRLKLKELMIEANSLVLAKKFTYSKHRQKLICLNDITHNCSKILDKRAQSSSFNCIKCSSKDYKQKMADQLLMANYIQDKKFLTVDEFISRTTTDGRRNAAKKHYEAFISKNLNPITPYLGAERHVWFVCPNNHLHSIRPSNVTSKNYGCALCRQVNENYEAITAEYLKIPKKLTAEEAIKMATNKNVAERLYYSMLALNIHPISPIWDATKMVHYKCLKCSLQHCIVPSTADTSNVACPSCAETGFDSSKPAFLYILKNETNNDIKIGITKHLEQRLKEHKANGLADFELVKSVHHSNGALIADLEKSILTKFDKLKLPTKYENYNQTAHNKRHGKDTIAYHTEVVSGECFEQILKILYNFKLNTQNSI